MEYAKSCRYFHNHTHFDARRIMICLEIEYFNLNRILLLTVGLWPLSANKTHSISDDFILQHFDKLHYIPGAFIILCIKHMIRRDERIYADFKYLQILIIRE